MAIQSLAQAAAGIRRRWRLAGVGCLPAQPSTTWDLALQGYTSWPPMSQGRLLASPPTRVTRQVVREGPVPVNINPGQC